MISDVFLDHSTYAEPPSRLVNLFHLKYRLVSKVEDERDFNSFVHCLSCAFMIKVVS